MPNRQERRPGQRGYSHRPATRFLPCWALLAVLTGLATGCKVGPDYEPAVPESPPAWAELDERYSAEHSDDTLASWWAVYDDPLLNRYIEQARENNYDLRIAFARIDEAAALLGIAKGPLVPQVDLSTDATRTDFGQTFGSPSDGARSSTSVNVGASWEIDLFGRIRRSIESAYAGYEATIEDRGAVQLVVAADVVRLYVEIRTAQVQLKSAEKNILSQREVVELTRTRFKYGLASDLEVAQSEQVLTSSEAELPVFRTDERLFTHALAVVLGRSPGDLEGELGAAEEIPLPDVRVGSGVPADLLRRRPDIRSAERLLASQTARIGVATADLYPTLSLSGFIGLAAGGSADLFDSDSFTWQVGAPIRWQLFSGGRIRNQIRAEEARTEQALLNYERTLLLALQDVEDAIVAHREGLVRYAALKRSLDVAERTLRLSIALYKDGLADFLSTLDAEREVFRAAINVAEARGAASASLTQLYRALGGGWDPAVEGSPGANEAIDTMTGAGTAGQQEEGAE